MIAYLDSSAPLRIVLREAGALDDLRTYDGLVSSELTAVESARTIDRLRCQGALIWRDRMGPLPTMATHDTALGAAARAFGFDVLGVG